MPVIWIKESVVLALHEEHLAEHGGAVGIRDRGLLESALFRPQNLASDDDPDFAALAAAYGFGLVRNHPFIDGNKRTAFTVTELFLVLNGQELIADDPSCVVTLLRLAEGSLSEKEFAGWIRANTKPTGLMAA
ncbi:MAG: type II toxin-antitoxin system death-on-curing family toxin [Methylococcaceae bacterium]|nr:type II toxin-antitoxin system death-on-curing family toxin [Methylococcaceae bacterium]